MQIYSNWCERCKKLEPEYNKLGKLFESNSLFIIEITIFFLKDSNEIIIAKIDGIENELIDPKYQKIKGFPTIFLYIRIILIIFIFL